MNSNKLLALSDIIMLYVSFQSLINDHEDFKLMVEQEASNLITCVDTSLTNTNTSCLIESIEMPRDT